MKDESYIVSGLPVTHGDHSLVHEYRGGTSQGDVVDSFLEIDDTGDRTHADTVVHGNNDAVPGVAVHDPFHPDEFAEHDYQYPCCVLTLVTVQRI
jgi:hypothetical protein